MLRPYLDYLQVKDALAATGEVVPAGEGDGELRETRWPRSRDDGYSGFARSSRTWRTLTSSAASRDRRRSGAPPAAFRSLADNCRGRAAVSAAAAHPYDINSGDKHMTGRFASASSGWGPREPCTRPHRGWPRSRHGARRHRRPRSREARGRGAESFAGVPFYDDYRRLIERASRCDHHLRPAFPASRNGDRAPRAWPPRAGGEARGGVLRAGRTHQRSRGRPARGALRPHVQSARQPAVPGIKEIVDAGEIGGIIRSNWIITTWWRPQGYYDQSPWRATWGGEGGGVLVNQAPHQLDLWQWLCGVPEWSSPRCVRIRRDIVVEDEVTGSWTSATGRRASSSPRRTTSSARIGSRSGQRRQDRRGRQPDGR